MGCSSASSNGVTPTSAISVGGGAGEPVSKSGTPAEEPCRREASDAELAAASATEMVIAAVDRARTDDARCGPPADADRICRALFVLSVLDPARHLEEPETLARSSEALLWVLRDAATIAPPKLRDSLTALAGFTSEMAAVAASPQSSVPASNELALLIERRADPAITDPISVVWETC